MERVLCAIRKNGVFYKSALKVLKREFVNTYTVSHLKLQNNLKLPSISLDNDKGLRHFHQLLEGTVTSLNSMGYASSLKSTDNVTKAILRLRKCLRIYFYKKFTAKNFDEENINLIKLESWLGNKINSTFNSIASVIESEFKSKHNYKISNFNTNHTSTDKDSLGNKQIHVKSKYTCWFCKGDYIICNCDKIKESSVHMQA